MWGSCKKDLDDSIENISEPISNLEETPEALLGSWNLRQNNSNIDSVVNECEAENIHFLNFQKKLVKAYGYKLYMQ